MFKTIQAPSTTRHMKEVTIPKLRNTIAAVSWRGTKEKAQIGKFLDFFLFVFVLAAFLNHSFETIIVYQMSYV